MFSSSIIIFMSEKMNIQQLLMYDIYHHLFIMYNNNYYNGSHIKHDPADLAQ